MRASCHPHVTIGWYEPQTGRGLDSPSYIHRAADVGLRGMLAALGRVGARGAGRPAEPRAADVGLRGLLAALGRERARVAWLGEVYRIHNFVA